MFPTDDRRRAKLLVVDDEPSVLDALAELCFPAFDVVKAVTAEQALAAMEDHRDLSVVLTDQRMPVMTGTELLVKAAELQPEATRILLTGYADIEVVIRAINDGAVYRYVTKPWDNDELITVLEQASERNRLIRENRRLLDAMAGEAPESTRSHELGASASELEKALLARDNERLLHILAHFEDSFWHLRKLQEVLPLCMDCGKVRDEDGRWTPLPKYLQRSAAFLSHGYCQDCERRALEELERNAR